MRLILVPQYPSKLRYSEWWLSEFPKQLSNYFDEIIVLGKNSDLVKRKDELYKDLKGLFLPTNLSSTFEFIQISEYNDMKIYYDDIVLLLDSSFPGYFANALYHKRPHKAFAFCHATSINNFDYYDPINKRCNNSKLDSEIAQFKLFDKVFVSSLYHKNKLLHNNFPDNIVALQALPNPPFKTKQRIKSSDFKNKNNFIVSVSRPTQQKVNLGIESFVEKHFNTKIIRPSNCKNWDDYYNFLYDSKILLLSGKEDTYGYSIVDAHLNNCNVVAPNDFAYPELITYHGEQLYDKDNLNSLIFCIEQNSESFYMKELKNQTHIDKFYDNLAVQMFE